MDVFDCIYNRRSIRKYTEEPVEFDKITKIIDAAAHAPSAGNMQNWRFIIVTDRGLINKLYEHCLQQEVILNAQSVIVICGDIEKAERLYGLRGKRLYTTQNCACAIQNMLLAAHALGLGACWIGAFDESKISTMFDIPDSARPQAIITIGYPAEKPESSRKNLNSVVFFNQHGLKIKDVHLELRDYSVEVEKQLKIAESTGKKAGNNLVTHGKKILDRLKSKSKK